MSRPPVSRRVSHSLLDPWVGPPLKKLYPILHIPRWFPPEGIVLIGHASAITAACGFAYSTATWWGGWLAAAGVLGNHTADCLDGTHARATGQCRNGGELLDHFTDPLSFAFYLTGIAVACGRLDLGLAAVICLFAHAILTNIKAKMTGEFQLASFGPTEFKTLLVLLGGGLALSHAGPLAGATPAIERLRVQVLTIGFAGLIAFGIVQLLIQLVRAIREVNASGGPVDTSEWETVRQKPTPTPLPAHRPDSNGHA